MNRYRYLLLAAVVCAVLAIAGCTTPANPAATATPASAPSLSSLAIDRNDLPEGFVLTMSREKNATEMGSLAKSLGWQAGYVAEYTKSTDTAGNQVVVLHSLATYPESSMPDIIGYVNRTDHSYSDLAYFDIQLTGLGGNSRGFVGYVPAQGMSLPEETVPATSGPLSAGSVLVENTPTITYGQNFIEIIFSKGSTFEVIRMSGPVVDVKEAIAIAQKAYAKIP